MTLHQLTASSVETLSLEEKVGQVLMVHFHGEEVNEDAKTLVQDLHVGSIIYYNWSNGLTSPRRVCVLSKELQSLAKIPLFIATDQEGGLVARLKDGFTIFPGNRALCMTGQPELARECALAMGKELKAVGVNMNLAPVLDVNSNPRNPIIGIRSFGDHPEDVVRFAAEVLKGFRQAGICTVSKHYPGHGDLSVDSHFDLPVVKKEKKQLYSEELFPFLQCAPLFDAVMSAHILVPALDPDHPSTLSAKTIDILRREAKFEGPFLTDSLVMQGILKNYQSVEEVAVEALKAGCDIILLGGRQLFGEKESFELKAEDIRRIHNHLVHAVQTNRIPRERLDQAVERILSLKRKIVSAQSSEDCMVGDSVSTAEHQELAKKIARLALWVVSNGPRLHLDQQKVLLVAPDVLREPIEQTTFREIGKETTICFFKGLNPSVEEAREIMRVSASVDVCVFCSYNAWKNAEQAVLVNQLLDTTKPVVIVAARDPLDAALFPRASHSITTYSPTAPSLEASFQTLRK